MVTYTDFTGFIFNGKTSEELGVLRPSDGSRYSELLLPQMKDTSVDPTGADGQLFFSTYYKSKAIPLNLAYDSLTEVQLRQLRKTFDGRQPHDFILYERPYKVYKAKVTGTPELKFICFDERIVSDGTTYNLEANGPDPIVRATHDDGIRVAKSVAQTPVRIYKGEGTVQLTVYTSFAHTPENGKFLDGAAYTSYPNVDEWKESAGLLETQGIYDIYDDGVIPVYNPGDIATPFKLKFTVATTGAVSISLGRQSAPADYQINLTATAGDEILLDSKTGLLYLCDSNHNPTSTVVNNLIVSGTALFKISPCTVEDEYEFSLTNVSSASIQYDYLYF